MGRQVDIERITTNDVMAIFEVSERTVGNWRKSGMPSMKDGNVCYYSLPSIMKWHMEKGSSDSDSNDINELKRQGILLDNRKKEIEIEVLEGGLVVASHVQEAWIGAIERAKGRILAVPSQVAKRCEHRTADYIKEEIERELAIALEELSEDESRADVDSDIDDDIEGFDLNNVDGSRNNTE